MTNNKLYAPSSIFSDYILSYLIIEDVPPVFPSFPDKPSVSIYPNGLNALGFSFGGPTVHSNHTGNESRLNKGCFVIGTQENTYKTISSCSQRAFLIIFRPGVLGPLLRISMTEIKNSITGIGNYIKEEYRICEQLSLAENHRQQIAIIENWLPQKLQQIGIGNNLTYYFIRDIIACGGDIKVNDLCKAYKINKKYIERKFDECLGISPKKYADIIRFNTLLGIMASNDYERWPEINAAAGFNDYSHLSKHISKLTGLQPKDLREKLEYMDEHKFIVDTTDLFRSFWLLRDTK